MSKAVISNIYMLNQFFWNYITLCGSECVWISHRQHFYPCVKADGQKGKIFFNTEANFILIYDICVMVIFPYIIEKKPVTWWTYFIHNIQMIHVFYFRESQLKGAAPAKKTPNARHAAALNKMDVVPTAWVGSVNTR